MSKATDFSALAQAVKQLGDAIQDKMAKREALAQERDRVAGLPMSRADLISSIGSWVDSVKPIYLKHLKETLAPRSRRADRPLPESRHGDFGLLGDQLKAFPLPIFALMGPQIKDALAGMVRELDLPDDEALPAAERTELLATLDGQIEALDSEIAALHRQAESVGLAPLRRKPTPEEVKALFANQSPTRPEDIVLEAENLERSLNGEPPLKRPNPPPKRELIPDADLPSDF